jgi:hypothetical protein
MSLGGIAILNSAGRRVYDSNDVTWNQIDSFVKSRPSALGGGRSLTRNYPQLEGREFLGVQVFIDPPPLDRKALAWNFTRSGTSITISGGSERALILVLMR